MKKTTNNTRISTLKVLQKTPFEKWHQRHLLTLQRKKQPAFEIHSDSIEDYRRTVSWSQFEFQILVEKVFETDILKYQTVGQYKFEILVFNSNWYLKSFKNLICLKMLLSGNFLHWCLDNIWLFQNCILSW